MNKKAILIFQAACLGTHIHPFVMSEVSAFCDRFNEVHLVCFDFPSSNNELDIFSNLKIHKVNIKSISGIIKIFPNFFRFYGLEDVAVAIKTRKFSFGYIKSCMKMLLFGSALINTASKVLKLSRDDEKWIVEGYWLSGPALAAAYLKQKNPEIYAFARAHSSEIDYIRNPYCICQFKKYIDAYLDAKYFISNWAKKNYETVIMPMHKSIETKNNIVVRLGVNKLDGKMNPWHESDKIRILTCSRAVKLKQLDLLAKVLINNDFNKPIEWVHIGDGPVLDEIKQICSLPKQNLTCTFLGAMSNDMVHQYFTENSVDWFINVSQYEGLPVSIMESMAYGIPTIATAVGATDEIVNESNGFILPDKISEEILIHALHQAFEMSADTYKVYRNQAYETWADNFNKDKNYSDMFVKIGVEK